METAERPLVIVDAANTVGSVPDGWWRDRHGAAERLRDRLVRVAAEGLPPARNVPEWAVNTPVDVVLVVEGAARNVESVPGIRVEPASGSGDDRIVEVAQEASGRRTLVITSDRELRRRVAEHGAAYAGPRAVRPEAREKD
ncbi:NTP pyrophosphohydrolase [Streptomyces sp. NPDC002055]|uniref:NTP pyrophosphohydrolase n=1 Tax=Streptomyces sp. NPDC002055 TaxID=3154534 RepID=UPI003323E593